MDTMKSLQQSARRRRESGLGESQRRKGSDYSTGDQETPFGETCSLRGIDLGSWKDLVLNPGC